MSAAPDRVIVLGGGAIGSLYAAKLAPRCDVTLIARAAHVDAINRNGLRLVGIESAAVRLRASTTVEDVPARALLLLTTKVNDSRAAVSAIADRVRDDTIIVCVQNGLTSEEIVKEIVGDRCIVLRAITQFGAIFQGPGVIDYKAAGYTLLERHAVSADVAALLTASGLEGRISDDIRIDVWRKLIFNCVINPITSIVGVDVGGIADPRLDALKRLVIGECLAVARADGVDVGRLDDDVLTAITRIFGASRNVASMRQDLLKGKPTEIEFLNGAVVDRGRRHGIECPVNAALAAIIKAMEAAR